MNLEGQNCSVTLVVVIAKPLLLPSLQDGK